MHDAMVTLLFMVIAMFPFFLSMRERNRTIRFPSSAG